MIKSGFKVSYSPPELRKSGIPVEQEMPAPVNTTILLMDPDKIAFVILDNIMVMKILSQQDTSSGRVFFIDVRDTS